MLLPFSVFSKTAEEWKSRSVYQIITDRFARTDGDTQACTDLTNYCGGTFKGIQNNLDYIKGMGFDAIWISPVTHNTPGGYHGYWTDNLYEINEKFGTAEELKELIDTCHEKDIWVMVDVVANHVGYVDWVGEGENFGPVYTKIVPFNDPAHYNPYLQCEKINWKNQTEVEACWLSGLPDLDQNHPFVKETLLNWAADFSKIYNIDALRIDTIPHVSRAFWAEFSKASGVYTVGEVLNYDDLAYIASYQGAVDGVLNYALYTALRNSFLHEGSMKSIESYYDAAHATWLDISVIGNFINNHDNPRFLSISDNLKAFKAALGFTIASVGVPMVYYGDEHAFSGGQDPLNRETLWGHMNTDSEIYQFLKALNTFRKNTHYYKHDQVQRYVDDHFYAFTRGDYLFAFTNSKETQSATITSHPYSEGTQLCNIFEKGDCVDVKDGEFTIELVGGEMKAYAPNLGEREEPEGIASIWKSLKAGIATGSMFGAEECGRV